MSHPSLTPAQAERLEMLAEEANEVSVACTKILRHGYESRNPDVPDSETNHDALCRELNDLCAIGGKMSLLGDIDGNKNVGNLHDIWQRKLRYTHHQDGSLKKRQAGAYYAPDNGELDQMVRELGQSYSIVNVVVGAYGGFMIVWQEELK